MAHRGFDSHIATTNQTAGSSDNAWHAQAQSAWSEGTNHAEIVKVNETVVIPLFKSENLDHAKKVTGGTDTTWESIAGGAAHIGTRDGAEIPHIIILPVE